MWSTFTVLTWSNWYYIWSWAAFIKLVYSCATMIFYFRASEISFSFSNSYKRVTNVVLNWAAKCILPLIFIHLCNVCTKQERSASRLKLLFVLEQSCTQTCIFAFKQWAFFPQKRDRNVENVADFKLQRIVVKKNNKIKLFFYVCKATCIRLPAVQAFNLLQQHFCCDVISAHVCGCPAVWPCRWLTNRNVQAVD